MITDNGKVFFKRFASGKTPSLVGAISVGIGSAAATAADTRMQFELIKVPVLVTDYDFTSDKLIFKGSLSESVAGVIHEVGLWTSDVASGEGSQGDTLVTSFDSETEQWSVSTFDAANTRMGGDSLKLTPAAGTTASATWSELAFDFSEYSAADTFTLAYYVSGSSTASLSFRLKTDAANYYQFTVNAPTNGYKIVSFSKGSATVVGTPYWGEISEIEVRATATGAASGSVQFDGIRINDVDAPVGEHGMLCRYVLPTPINKKEGMVQDIEYVLSVNV